MPDLRRMLALRGKELATNSYVIPLLYPIFVLDLKIVKWETGH